ASLTQSSTRFSSIDFQLKTAFHNVLKHLMHRVAHLKVVTKDLSLTPVLEQHAVAGHLKEHSAIHSLSQQALLPITPKHFFLLDYFLHVNRLLYFLLLLTTVKVVGLETSSAHVY